MLCVSSIHIPVFIIINNISAPMAYQCDVYSLTKLQKQFEFERNLVKNVFKGLYPCRI